MKVSTVPLDTLQLDPANVRTHGDRNMDAIAASLQRFGQAEPLVVQQSSRRVIGGNGRLQAMKQLGWTECDIVELDVDDLQATALAIALNRTASLAEWDEPGLARLLEQLKAEDALDGVGFDETELDDLLGRYSVHRKDEGKNAPAHARYYGNVPHNLSLPSWSILHLRQV